MFVLAIFTNYSQYKIISFSSNEIDYYEFHRIYIIYYEIYFWYNSDFRNIYFHLK